METCGNLTFSKESRIGFIGMGIMGRPMAGHIFEAGYPLMVYNRSAGKTDELAGRGVRVARTPAEVGAWADVVITMVSDSPDVESVVTGADGLCSLGRRFSVLIDMSTISPTATRRLSGRLARENMVMLDCPVSGGEIGAIKGELTIFGGGDEATFERLRPLLETMGTSLNYLGASGAGQVCKMCNQVTLSGALLGVCEGLQLARRFELDGEAYVQAIRGGSAGSAQLEQQGDKLLAEDYSPGFFVDYLQKDLKIALSAADDEKLPLLGASLVHQLFQTVQKAGCGREGTQALYKALAALDGEH